MRIDIIQKRRFVYSLLYVVLGKEEIVADRDVEIPGMEEDMLDEITTEAVVEPYTNVEVMNLDNNQNEISRLKELTDSARNNRLI